jgi:hypothetical protein
MRFTRRLRANSIVCAALSTLLTATSAHSEDTVTRANRMAYDTAIKCFIADGLASDERHDAGDESGADAYRRKARQSFDVAYTAGNKLGMTDKQVSRDLDFAQATELTRMMRDRRYFLSTAATCKAVGLM